MNRLTENKIIIITRRTRLDEMVTKFNTLDQAKFYIERQGCDFTDYQIEDQIYKRSLSNIERELKILGRVQMLERTYLPNFIFGNNDTVVVVGQDGLVVNTLKYLVKQPIIAVNPDPKRWDGVLLPFNVSEVGRVVQDLFRDKCKIREVTLAKASLNNGQYMYGVNDLFIGPKSHISARYVIEIGNKKEQHSSSGIIVSTGLGSTGWLRSIVTGARGIVGDIANHQSDVAFDWSADYLLYNVREPFPSNITSTNLIFGKISSKNKMVLTSLMASEGVIFSDGIESDFIEFNSGTQATIDIAEKRGYLVI